MDVLYIDDSILVVNKPAGLPVLPDGWEKDAPYLVRELEHELGADASSGKVLWIVHRLDKSTSGVIVFARSSDAHRNLSRQFELHQADKIYRLILEGLPDWDEQVARYPLRVNVGHKHRTAVDPRDGKPAETRFEVLERFEANALSEAHPKTGRTHQIRAHAHAIGYPLLGDILYGAQPTGLIDRPALHSYRLTITHPVSGERQTYTASYPHDFLKALERLNVPTS